MMKYQEMDSPETQDRPKYDWQKKEKEMITKDLNDICYTHISVCSLIAFREVMGAAGETPTKYLAEPGESGRRTEGDRGVKDTRQTQHTVSS